ncbi:DUF6602 domain-containing protein [Paenibacillus popilliae]|uniref:DUF6602 domain-containing protein n=1 Tax=Paenibacillus popilliae ATCC 14706 TaxID=1212764 RepID=M9LM96_PAEPP|nr:DUF6602 domain-containing protein [Paenibacillus popilliae]GAC41226.1 hypothetical protein PPOP_0576 [Paenibacillus popilliae ATCC 14706]
MTELARCTLEPDTKTINDIIHNYIETERSMVSQLYFKHQHGSSIGGFREEIWKEFFQQIVPRKFVAEQSVFIIDSSGQVSNEVDLAVFDETYTPYIFRKGRLKFIPIEAVAVAVECKSLSSAFEKLEKWKKSITKLKTSRNAIARMHSYIATENVSHPSTQTGTRPLFVFCYLGEEQPKNAGLFDFALRADKEHCRISIHRNDKIDTLKGWFNSLNHNDPEVEDHLVNKGKGLESGSSETERKTDYSLNEYRVLTVTQQEVSLLSFNFQINQLLMLINNPMLFPHKAYVDLFNKNTGTGTDTKACNGESAP